MSKAWMSDELDIPLAHFIELSCPCFPGPIKAKHRLPDTSSLFQEEPFADLFLAWDKEGIGANVHFHQKFQGISVENFKEGDSISLFIDTRAIKEAKTIHRFCHHFVFLPKDIEGKQAWEEPHFRGLERHELCPPSLLSCETTFSRASFETKIFIPKEALYGYDPLQFNRLGFTYLLTQAGQKRQHFSLSSHHYKIEDNPALWATLSLEGKV